ncbi:putative permease [Pseudocercospora fuligena]|uniref:Putative permease n=1 Tax=Pseudocercospora fuligena TaxID=685502 RepID=A0A8H6VMZ5_9PEZI|nr:putative permease [Pseudocercospora fuligena]
MAKTLFTMTVRERVGAVKANLKAKRRLSGWVLPKEETSFADKDSYSNIDSDVTPLERRTWTTWTIFGFWVSDAMNAQGWMAPASIIAVGLTYREAIYSLILGLGIVSIPLVLNGAIGAHLHIPFPVAARSSFGFLFARFAVVTRMVTALFWHAIQTYTGSTALTQMLRAIWPSYLDIPNHLPASAGITSQQLLSHFLFWSIQFPILLIPPHKLRWFFVFKVIVTVTASTATVIAMTSKAGGTGHIWDQEYRVHGAARSWLTLAAMMSCAGGWATMATNVPDFTRYLKSPKGYINIRRGVVFAAIIGGWVMVPWKIISSAQSLLTFMTGLAIFLAPISAILACDYWLVKKRHIDVPSLYRRHARYKYWHGINWRAAVAFLCSVTPNIPGLARASIHDDPVLHGVEYTPPEGSDYMSEKDKVDVSVQPKARDFGEV